MTDEKTELSTTTIDDLLNEKKLVLYNDNHNSFQYVMLALSNVLNYTLEQSEQIALIVHNKGKAIIKTGNYNKLKNYYNNLKEFNLTLEIQ